MATTTTDTLNSLLRGEISATETYTQALEKFAGHRIHANLQTLRDEHRATANTLREHIRSHAGEPDSDSGWWGTWAKLVEGTAKLFGETAALKALKEGEEHGVNSYQAALKDEEVSVDCKALIRSQLLPRTQAHVQMVDRLMTTVSGS